MKVLSTLVDIQCSAISFYQDLLFDPSQSLDPIHPDFILRLLTEVGNMKLNRPSLIHDVRGAIFSIDGDSCAGYNGFSSLLC